MAGSEDHRGSRGLVDLSEVSHARVTIIADLCPVVSTGGCHRARHRRITYGAGTSTGSTRSSWCAASPADRGECSGVRCRGRLPLLHRDRRVDR